MSKQQEMLDLADEIEERTVPVPMDLILIRNERALICETLRNATRMEAALEKIACRHVTEAPLWWQLEARSALTNGNCETP